MDSAAIAQMKRGHVLFRRSAGPDHGVATVLSAVLSLALLGVVWIGFQLGSVMLTRHRAEGAADLVALAAASHASQGQEFACRGAGWIAREMRAEVASCALDGWDARVRIRADPPGIPLKLALADARARAGPTNGSAK